MIEKTVRAVIFERNENGDEIIRDIFEFNPRKTLAGKFDSHTQFNFDEILDYLGEDGATRVQLEISQRR